MKNKRTAELLKRALRTVAPPEKLTISQWADKYRMLSGESSARKGPWYTAAYQREPMDAISDMETETVVLMWSSQTGKSDVQNNVIGYYTHIEPSPIMMVQPSLEKAKEYSKDRVGPMYRDSPALATLVNEGKRQGGSNTVLYKSFPGGRINFAGANSPESLASKPIRIVLADEIDRFPASAGKEGNPVDLVTVRQETFPDRKRILVSTPTIKGASEIEKFYESSSMEQWMVPCPSCNEYQTFTQAKMKFEYNKETRECTHIDMACEYCGALHSENEWKKDYENRGKWVARVENKKVRGFHLNAFASSFVTWKHIISKFLKAKNDEESLKVYINTSLAESWEPKTEAMDHEVLMSRAEHYEYDVPDGVKILTCAIDTQDDRFEVEVQGWGAGYENWHIDYKVIHGDPKQPEIWKKLDEYISQRFEGKDGRMFPISITLMDSGGHFSNEVYKFTKARQKRHVFAVRGMSTAGASNQYIPLIHKMTDKNKHNAKVYTLGVDEGKFKVQSAWDYKKDEDNPEGRGVVHFPAITPERNRGYTEPYYKSLTAEVLTKSERAGVTYMQWRQIRSRNEAFDLAVYNRAGIELLNVDLDKYQLPKLVKVTVEENGIQKEVVKQKVTVPSQRKKRKTVKSSI